MVRHMRLLLADLSNQLAHALLANEQGLQNSQACLVAQRSQNTGTLARGQHGGQQQLPLGAQETASPSTASLARLMIAKCRLYGPDSSTSSVFEQISSGTPRR